MFPLTIYVVTPLQMFPPWSWTSTQRLKSSSLPFRSCLPTKRCRNSTPRVDVDGEDYITVALDFLKEENLIAD